MVARRGSPVDAGPSPNGPHPHPLIYILLDTRRGEGGREWLGGPSWSPAVVRLTTLVHR